ncbi:MAG: SRPBCC family protein [Tepidiformaceae bacterium]
MRLHRFTATQFLPVDVETAWGFFSDPRNLQTMTPPWLNLVPTSEVPREMHPGLIVTYRVKPALGISVAWVTEITHVVDRQFFVDEQRSGPYRFWHHQHHFNAVPGGTEARDVLHYALPLGLIGNLAGAALVKNRVAGIFEYRRRALEQRFGARQQPLGEQHSSASPQAVLGLV